MNEDPRPGDANPIHWAAILGGAVLGCFGTWALFAVVLLVEFTQYGDNTTTAQGVLLGAALLLIPAVSGALMIPRRTRQLGAGSLMGVAIGSLVGAGICASTMAG